MPKKEPETQYTPKGYEIPVPDRDDVLRVFDKAAQPLPAEDEPKKRKLRRRRGPKK